MRKKLGLLGLIVTLLTATFWAAACSKRPGNAIIGGDDDRLASVEASSIVISETPSELRVTWKAVERAASYVLSCGAWTYEETATTVNLKMQYVGFDFPSSGEMKLGIVARGFDIKDSKPTYKTYKTEGIALGSPEIIGFDNGIIEWRAEGNPSSYLLKVGNSFVSDADDGYYHSTVYDTRELAADAKIDIVAIGDGVWCKNSDATSIFYKAAEKKLTLLPVREYSLDGETLKWNKMGGVDEYRVVDIDFNTTIVTAPVFDMSGKNVIYGVYPISKSNCIEDAEISPVDIPYLSGQGTTADPYLIKTPFDLRAIDYYELKYFEKPGSRNVYRIENDMDYNAVNALESDSNIYTLHKEFYGTLDGNGKRLSNIRVNYDGGYWALFDMIAPGATVRDITFDSPEINNKPQDAALPLDPSVAMVADSNFGTISGITISNAIFSATGGEVCGIATHNSGKVTGCVVSGTFIQNNTSAIGPAGYEMAGIVLENRDGGIVEGNNVQTLTIRGTNANVRSAAGIVAINRKGGTVRNNSFGSVTITGMVASSEYGGITAYNDGATLKGSGSLGTLTVGGLSVTAEKGGEDGRGKLVGKNGVNGSNG